MAIVRRAVKAARALSDTDTSEHRVKWATALGQLGFDEAVLIARRVDQKKIQEPRQIDAIWALWRISLNQAKGGNFDGAHRVTLREATRLETPPKADGKELRGRLAYGFVVAKGFDEAIKIAGTLDPEVPRRDLVAGAPARAARRRPRRGRGPVPPH